MQKLVFSFQTLFCRTTLTIFLTCTPKYFFYFLLLFYSIFEIIITIAPFWETLLVASSTDKHFLGHTTLRKIHHTNQVFLVLFFPQDSRSGEIISNFSRLMSLGYTLLIYPNLYTLFLTLCLS